MSYCLKLREPLFDGLKRIFREQIQSALELCRHPAKDRAVTVHEVRKHLKKLRAALRLTKDEVGKNRYAREDRCVREIGRLVSDLRDAHVRLQTLIQLRDDAKQQFPRIEELLSMERESFSAAFAGWQKQAIPKLERVDERLSKWPLADITWKQICGVVAKIYGRGQDRLDEVTRRRLAAGAGDADGARHGVLEGGAVGGMDGQSAIGEVDGRAGVVGDRDFLRVKTLLCHVPPQFARYARTACGPCMLDVRFAGVPIPLRAPIAAFNNFFCILFRMRLTWG
jgi:hypothetical protein